MEIFDDDGSIVFNNDPGGGSDWRMKEDAAVACRVEVLSNVPCDGDRVHRTSISPISIKKIVPYRALPGPKSAGFKNWFN